LGDGDCDDGESGPNFECPELTFDMGDCLAGGVDGGDVDADDVDADDVDADDVDADDVDADDDSDSDGGSSPVGGCVFEGVCVDGMAYGECMDFGGTHWYADGCPEDSDGGAADGSVPDDSDGGSSDDGAVFDPVVGGECREGWVYDCALNCASESLIDDWIGDGHCDDGATYDLDCAEFDYDGGDCEESGDSDGGPADGPVPDDSDGGSSDDGAVSDPVVGEGCAEGRVYDCALYCADVDFIASWIGDGYCDDGTPYDLYCAEFDYDEGDCEESGDSDGGAADGPVPDDSDGSSDSDGGSSSIGGCVLDGVCYDGMAYGECMDFGGTDWYADGCSEDSDGGPADGPVPDDGGGSTAPGESCGDSMIYDCAENCVGEATAESWAVDSECDGVDEAWGMHLDCAYFDYDDGACDTEED
jgi:hypothetical protein